MLVVSDTTTLTNLIKIDLIHLVRKLYGRITIPQAVYDELIEVSANEKFLKVANWISVEQVKDRKLVEKLQHTLDLGESEAIVLAVELKADILIMDERIGRKTAEKYGLRIIGLLGILIGSKKRGYIDSVQSHIDVLIERYGFRVSESVYNKVLRLANEK